MKITINKTIYSKKSEKEAEELEYAIGQKNNYHQKYTNWFEII